MTETRKLTTVAASDFIVYSRLSSRNEQPAFLSSRVVHVKRISPIVAIATILAAFWMIAIAAHAQQIQTPSPRVDCAHARAPSDKTICATPELFAKDAEFSKLYDARLNSIQSQSGNVQGFISDWRRWLALRGICGKELSCLNGWYIGRIGDLRSSLQTEVVQRQLPLEACTVRQDANWTKAEIFVWAHVCRGEIADFNDDPSFGGKFDQVPIDELPLSRKVRSSFLEAILLQDRYRQALTWHGVRIVGARITETLDLANGELNHQLSLTRSIFESDIDFSALSATRPLVLDGSKIEGSVIGQGLRTVSDVSLIDAKINGQLQMSRAQIDGALNAFDAQVGGVDLSGARVRNYVNFSSARSKGLFSLDGAQIGNGVFMQQALFDADVSLSFAHVIGLLGIERANVRGPLNMTEIEVDGAIDMSGQAPITKQDGSIDMSGRAQFAKVSISGARVKNEVNLSYAKFAGPVDMSGTHIGNGLFMRQAEFDDVVTLVSVNLVGTLSLKGAKFNRPLNMNGIEIDGPLFMDDQAEFTSVDLGHAQVRQSLAFSGAKFSGLLEMNSIRADGPIFLNNGAEVANVDLIAGRVEGIDLIGAKVHGKLAMEGINVPLDIRLDAAEVAEPIGLEFATIGQNLELSGGNFRKGVDLTGTRIAGELRIDSSDNNIPTKWGADAVLNLRNARVGMIQDKPDSWPPKLDLIGFTYSNLRGSDVAEQDAPIGDRPAQWFRDHWFAGQTHYSTEPYEQLASVLRTEGQSDKADAILIEGKERERTDHATPFGRKVWLTVLKLVIGYGYGYRVWTALAWAASLVVIGGLVQWSRPEIRRFRWATTREFVAYWTELFFYSFEMLLPVIRVRGEMRQYKAGPQDIWFHFQNILGLALTVFLAAGLSGLTK